MITNPPDNLPRFFLRLLLPAAIAWVLFNPGPALAACASPAGNEGEILYNNAQTVLQFCDGTNWIGFPKNSGGSGGACSNPAGAAGDMLYNSASNVLQWCGNGLWHAAGPVPGTGGAGCISPTGTAGELIYNSQYKTPQYCDGAYWRRVKGDPCNDASPVPGAYCDDGTVYAGLSPDGNVKMYATHCDHGFTWNGTGCTGSVQTRVWNDGSTSWLDTPLVNCTGAGAETTCTTGRSNSAYLNTADSASTGGTQAHLAAQACENLTLHGHSDWYLPARHELTVLYTNAAAVGNFSFTTYYWSSSERTSDGAFGKDFATGTDANRGKNIVYRIRCVRR